MHNHKQGANNMSTELTTTEKTTKPEENKKESLLPLYVYLILKEKSSINAPLTAPEIHKILRDEFDVAHKEDRKLVPRCLRTLKRYLNEPSNNRLIVDVAVSDKITAWYFDPFYAPGIDRTTFTADEINMLSDMVASSQFVSKNSTNALLHKLAAVVNSTDRKNLRVKYHETNTHKTLNTTYLEYKNIIEKASCDFRQLRITYTFNNKSKEIIISPPFEIDFFNDRFYLLAYYKGKKYRFRLENIKSIHLGSEETEIYGDSEVNITNEQIERNQTIALDAVFMNLKTLTYAIKARQYISFQYLHFDVDNTEIVTTQSAIQRVFPLTTAYKNNKYFLIATKKKDDKYVPTFFRIDLMTNINLDGTMDTLEYWEIDEKDSDQYLAEHPFFLPEFTTIKASFLIEAAHFDKAIDYFGTKITPYGKITGNESAGTASRKLAQAFPILDFNKYTGFEKDKPLVRFYASVSAEEAVRFALLHGDVCELETPHYLRNRVLEIAETIQTRHKKSKD